MLVDVFVSSKLKSAGRPNRFLVMPHGYRGNFPADMVFDQWLYFVTTSSTDSLLGHDEFLEIRLRTAGHAVVEVKGS